MLACAAVLGARRHAWAIIAGLNGATPQPGAAVGGRGNLPARRPARPQLHPARRSCPAAQRIARHLWRMCFAFFIATGSFFLGQQDILPKAVQRLADPVRPRLRALRDHAVLAGPPALRENGRQAELAPAARRRRQCLVLKWRSEMASTAASASPPASAAARRSLAVPPLRAARHVSGAGRRSRRDDRARAPQPRAHQPRGHPQPARRRLAARLYRPRIPAGDAPAADVRVRVEADLDARLRPAAMVGRPAIRRPSPRTASTSPSAPSCCSSSPGATSGGIISSGPAHAGARARC